MKGLDEKEEFELMIEEVFEMEDKDKDDIKYLARLLEMYKELGYNPQKYEKRFLEELEKI